MPGIAEPLIDYLRQRERQGEKYVHLDDRARSILTEFFYRAKGKSSSDKSTVDPQISKITRKVRPADRSDNQKVGALQTSSSAASEVPDNGPSRQPISDSLDGLKIQIESDEVLKNIGTLRKQLIFSEGVIGSEIMLVGEAPSYYDESKMKPFSGIAGEKLEAILKAMGLSRKDVYMTNILKYRPAMANQTTNTRKPNVAEIDAFMPHLMAEIKLVNPKVIIVLGAIAAKSLIGPDVPTKKLLGQFHKVAGISVRATYHPSYLLHQGITDEKKAVWADMLAIMEFLKMPISDKQRGFFK